MYCPATTSGKLEQTHFELELKKIKKIGFAKHSSPDERLYFKGAHTTVRGGGEDGIIFFNLILKRGYLFTGSLSRCSRRR